MICFFHKLQTQYLPILTHTPIFNLCLKLYCISIVKCLRLNIRILLFTQILKISTNHVRCALKQHHSFGNRYVKTTGGGLVKIHSKQKVLLFPITMSTFCFFMCYVRLMKVVIWCQNQDAWKCALGARNVSERGGVKTTIMSAQRFPPSCRIHVRSFWPRNGRRWFPNEKRKSWIPGQVRAEKVLADAITIDGRKVLFRD